MFMVDVGKHTSHMYPLDLIMIVFLWHLSCSMLIYNLQKKRQDIPSWGSLKWFIIDPIYNCVE